MSNLPPFDPNLSDGCSMLPLWPLWMGRRRIQRWALRLVVRDVEAAAAICCAHDRAYYYGGTEDDRMEADLRWQDAMWVIDRTPEHWFTMAGFVKIRELGGPEHKIPGVSWAYGGERYVDDDE